MVKRVSDFCKTLADIGLITYLAEVGRVTPWTFGGTFVAYLQ